MFKLSWKCFIKFIKIKFNKIKAKYSRHVQYMQSYTNNIDLSDSVYEDLAPKDDVDKSDSYTNALDWSLTNNKIFNIALTGTFGAGKSSVLRTYEKKRPHYHYLNISLSSFYEQKKVNSKLEELEKTDDKIQGRQITVDEFDDIEIEKSILQQLFYKVRSSQIPYSRFRKIKNLKVPQLIIKVGIILLTLVLGIVLFQPAIIINLQSNIEVLKNFYNSKLLIGTGYFIFFILIFTIIISFLKYFNMRLRLSKITLQDTELDLDKANDESIFNKYLDEILYFFEVTQYNVVIIEDLDRFGNTRIFTKLRELNSFINKCEQIKNRIVFIYAIKDDMFKNKDRTKFFDFIIPVIPVINSSNSGEKLLEKIRQNEFGEEITDEFINGVSVYIDDMRILNNIYNEFVLYKNILTDVTLKSQQILALIIYKNLYPNDFAELQYNSGIIFQAFDDKKAFVKRKIMDMQEKRYKLEEKLNRANLDCLSSTKELKAAFLYSLTGEFGNINEIRVNWQLRYNINQIMNDDFDISLLDNDNLTIVNNNGNTSTSSMDNANQRSGSDFTYSQRLEDIKIKSKANQEQLKQEIQSLKSEEHTLSSVILKKLIDKFGAFNVMGEVILKEKTIVYLLRNGHINETYPNYLTYFYPNSLTAQDMNFILGVRNYEAFEFSFPLTKLDRVVSMLTLYEFEQKEILNIDLLEFLFENKEKYENHFNILIKQLCNETPNSIDFIDEFKDKTKFEKMLWIEICHQWHNIWNYIECSANFPYSKKDTYLKNIVKYADVTDIGSINYDNRLSAYISSNDKFLQFISNIDLLKARQVISDLDIKFEAIDIEKVNEDLLEYVFENDFYVINIQMIKVILYLKFPGNELILRKCNLSAIKEAGYSPLLNYINKNINVYLTNVFMKLETNINENIETIIELLNREDISEDIKNGIVDKENFELPNISTIPKLLWNKIIYTFKVRISWGNVITYYKEATKINKNLAEFLNSEQVYTNLSLNKVGTDNDILEENVASDFSDQLIASSISDLAFNYLVRSIPYTYSDYELGSLSQDRVDSLIIENILKFTVENYNNLKLYFSGKHIIFIEKHYKQYLSEQDKYIVDANDIYSILKLTCFSIEEKFQIISNLNISNVDDNSLKLIKNTVLGSTVTYNLSQELFNKIWIIIPHEDKLQLLINQIKFLDKHIITSCLHDLGESYVSITMPKKKVKMEYTVEILRLAKELKEWGYISTYTEINIGVDQKLVQFNTKAKIG